MRYHDNYGRLPRDWVAFQPDKSLRLKTISYIEEARHKVKSTQNKYTSLACISNFIKINYACFVFFSACHIASNVYANPCSIGFGAICDKSKKVGLPTVVPVIPENELEHDIFGLTINNGVFMVYEGYFCVLQT